MPRLLIVGEAPNRAGGPPFAGRSGRVLEDLAGPGFLGACDLVNLLPAWPGACGKGSLFPMPEARAAAAMLLAVAPHRVAVLAGKRVAAAFGLGGAGYLTWHLRGGKLLGVAPHPSGVNRWLNEPANREAAGAFLRSAARISGNRWSGGRVHDTIYLVSNDQEGTMTTITPIATIEEAAAAYERSDEGRLAVIAQARDEQRARKAALASGAEATASPALDYINSRPKDASRSRRAKAAAVPRGPAARLVRLHKDGKPLEDRYNNLGWLALRCGRLKVAKLKSILAEAGVADPDASTWEVTLPSGAVVAATAIDGRVSVPAAKVRRQPRRAATRVEAATPAKGKVTPAKAGKAPAKGTRKSTKAA